jgi:adenine-specific DNA-methyltransferase
LEDSGYFEQSDIVFSTLKSAYENKIDIKYFLGILNSKLIYNWFFYKGKRKGMQLELFQKPLSEVPVKLGSAVFQVKLVGLVNEILNAKKDNTNINISLFESQIDNLIYKLYELSYAEVKVIDPEFALTELEYEAIIV